MAGKFHKHWLYRPWRWLHFLPDWRMLRFYYSRRRRANNDDSLLLGLIAEFRAAGLDCLSALELCPELLVKEGVLTRRRPTPLEELDIATGWQLAREMGRLDIGQSVMISELAVLAVEAIEGTDRAIERRRGTLFAPRLRGGENRQAGSGPTFRCADSRRANNRDHETGRGTRAGD